MPLLHKKTGGEDQAETLEGQSIRVAGLELHVGARAGVLHPVHEGLDVAGNPIRRIVVHSVLFLAIARALAFAIALPLELRNTRPGETRKSQAATHK